MDIPTFCNPHCSALCHSIVPNFESSVQLCRITEVGGREHIPVATLFWSVFKCLTLVLKNTIHGDFLLFKINSFSYVLNACKLLTRILTFSTLSVIVYSNLEMNWLSGSRRTKLLKVKWILPVLLVSIYSWKAFWEHRGYRQCDKMWLSWLWSLLEQIQGNSFVPSSLCLLQWVGSSKSFEIHKW